MRCHLFFELKVIDIWDWSDLDEVVKQHIVYDAIIITPL